MTATLEMGSLVNTSGREWVVPRDSADDMSEQLAVELLESHRRVRGTAHDLLRGATVAAQKPADVLGVDVDLPGSRGAI